VFLLKPRTGPVNTILAHFGVSAPNWFNRPQLSKPALTMLALWGVAT
jgi:multiple sugar transport system permease protein